MAAIVTLCLTTGCDAVSIADNYLSPILLELQQNSLYATCMGPDTCQIFNYFSTSRYIYQYFILSDSTYM